MNDPKYSFLGVPIPTEDQARDLANRLIVRDEEYRTLITRIRTEDVVPATPAQPKCLCSHPRAMHGRNEPTRCFGTVCGCSRLRLPEGDSQ